jgi:hypothetical protein
MGLIMLEFTLLAWDSQNCNICNIITWTLAGISIASFEPVEPISEAGIGLSCLIGWLEMLELTLSMGIYCCEVPKACSPTLMPFPRICLALPLGFQLLDLPRHRA